MSHASRRGRADWSEDGHAEPGADCSGARRSVFSKVERVGGAGDEGHPAGRWIMT